MLTARVRFDIAAPTRHPTADGRTLEIAPETLDATITLRFEFRDGETMLPRDALAADIAVADRDGRVWTTTARFTSAVLVAHMFDFSALRATELFTPKTAGPEWTKALAGPVLEDVRFSSDDRFYRTLLVNGKRRRVQFKYTTLHFDVGVNQYEDWSYLTNLAVRLRRGSFWDEGSTLPEMGFFLELHHLLRWNTGAFSPGRGYWVETPIPRPLVFEPTGGAGRPQPNVGLV